jgi:hypothetical protein
MTSYVNKKDLPRTIIIANNKKQKAIKNVLLMRDEMIKTNMNNNLIQTFVNEQYAIINKEYEERINKYNKSKTEAKTLKLKKAKAIEFILKNKAVLEDNGVNKDYITLYVNKQYEEINEYYSKNNEENDNVNLETINFID